MAPPRPPTAPFWFLRSRGRWLAFVGLLFAGTLGCFLGGVRWVLHRFEQGAVDVVRRADLHHQALQLAEADPRAVAVLGSPMRAARVEVREHGRTPAGVRLAFTFPVQGPRGSGLMRAEALWARVDAPWRLERLELTYPGGTLQLTAPSAPGTP